LKIAVTGVDVSVSEVLRGKVVRRVLLALSRFGPRVRKVTVCLAEPVNPLGGVDQRCWMRAWLPESGDIQAEVINGGIEAAVARAAAQLAKRVDSALDGGASDGPGAPHGPGGRVDRRPASRTAPRGPAATSAQTASSDPLQMTKKAAHGRLSRIAGQVADQTDMLVVGGGGGVGRRIVEDE
jgi:ribosome-associated translation inhibitor RaiA